MGILCILVAAALVFGGLGFLAGFFVGRSTGRGEAQQGFPVLPASPATPVAPVAPVSPTAAPTAPVEPDPPPTPP
jgi:hypothetical protein